MQLCSGQSNMQFAIEGVFNASVAIASAGNYSGIRMYTALQAESATPQLQVRK